MSKATRKQNWKPRRDIRQEITDKIVNQLESAGQWQTPWLRNNLVPVNAATGKPYNGINVLSLWVDGQKGGFTSNEWATFKQWKAKGASVKKGETGAPVVFYKKLETDGASGNDSDDPEAEDKPKFVLSYSIVFNADQVNGYTPKAALAAADRPKAERIQAAEDFIKNTKADIRQDGGDRAFYNPKTDSIHLPPMDRFVGSSTSSSTEAFYATALHELTHWTGHQTRCNRDSLTEHKGFGSKEYAFEELVAELGSAFLSAELGISSEPREDHAAYLKGWISLLKEDKTAIFKAARQAQNAATFLHELQPKQQLENKLTAEINLKQDKGKSAMVYELTTKDEEIEAKIIEIIQKEGGIRLIDMYTDDPFTDSIPVVIDGIEYEIQRTMHAEVDEAKVLHYLKTVENAYTDLHLKDFLKGEVFLEGESYHSFEEYLEDDGWHYDQLVESVREHQEESINEFMREYGPTEQLAELAERAMTDFYFHHGAELEKKLELEEQRQLAMQQKMQNRPPTP